MRLLDLFCGAGGAAVGYNRAGFTEIIGVDIVPQPDYPYTFFQGDALDHFPLKGFDLVHASPPCQAFSVNTPDKTVHPDLIGPTRQLLDSYGLPYVIENVPGAPIRKDIMLCGSMFNMEVQRHRHFEVYGFDIWNPPTCYHNWRDGRPRTVTGHADGARRSDPTLNQTRYLGFRDTEHAKKLMEMPWVSNLRGITEAIPPAYTQWIGEQYMKQHHDQQT